LSPSDPDTFRYAHIIATAHLVARHFEQAIEWADRALQGQPRHAAAMRVKVVADAHLGRLDEAHSELSRVLAIDPKLTIAGFREHAHFMAPEVNELYVTGLRLAGLPEK
jgi:Flp pilus assembly protein TadD